MNRPILTAVLSLLAAGSVHAAEQGAVNVAPTDIGLWIWTLATFLVMFWLLARLAFRPISEALDRRAQTIREHLADAQRDREAAKKLMAAYEKQIFDARLEAAKLIEEARSMGDHVRKEVVEKARTEAATLLERAHGEIERQKQKSVQELKDTVAALSVQIASKIIEKEVDEALHRQLVDGLIEELENTRKAR